MRYGRIITVILIAIVSFYAYKFISLELTEKKTNRFKTYSRAIAETAVASEVYRESPDSFLIVRDSILVRYDLTIDSIDAIKSELEHNREDWLIVWNEAKRVTDSLLDIKLEELKSDSLTDSLNAS